MGCEGWERTGRTVLAWFISFLIIVAAFILILIFKNLRSVVRESSIKLTPTRLCVDNKSLGLVDRTVQLARAYEDYKQPVDKQKGFISCICYN